MEQILKNSTLTALLEDSDRKAGLELLRKHVLLYSYDIMNNVPYDGNCFFNAVASLIDKDEEHPMNGKDLRTELCTYLKKTVSSCYLIIVNS